MSLHIDDLMITNVSQRKSVFFIDTIEIRFEIDRFRYSLDVSEREDGMFYPWRIDHLEEYKYCQYCEHRSSVCPGLRDSSKELFHRLIEFPSIRLEWLYINHV